MWESREGMNEGCVELIVFEVRNSFEEVKLLMILYVLRWLLLFLMIHRFQLMKWKSFDERKALLL